MLAGVRGTFALVAMGLAANLLLLSNVIAAEAVSPSPSASPCPNGQAAYTQLGGYRACAFTRTSVPAPTQPRAAVPTTPRRRPSTSGSGTDGDAATTCADPRTWDTDVFNNTAPPTARPASAKPGAAGRWAYVTCGANNFELAAQGGSWIWTGPTGTAAVPALPAPETLAQQAYEDLRPPALTVDYRPRYHAGGPETTLVGLRTFLRAEPASLQATSRRAAAGANWAQVTTVQAVTFDPGDGSAPVVCPNGGTPYNPSLPVDQQVADCWHAYARPSAGGPFQLRAAVTWTATWTGSGGTGGVLPALTVTATVAVPVQEVQTVNNGSTGE